jgi:hypothetical protein
MFEGFKRTSADRIAAINDAPERFEEFRLTLGKLGLSIPLEMSELEKAVLSLRTKPL